MSADQTQLPQPGDAEREQQLLATVQKLARVLRDLDGNAATAAALGLSEGTVSRLASGNEQVPIGAQRAQQLLEILPRLIEEAKIRRFMRATVKPMYVVLDRCCIEAVPDCEVIEAVHQNLRLILTDSKAEGLALPKPEHGVLIRLGRPEFCLFLVQVSAGRELAQLKILAHELQHLIQRLDTPPPATDLEAAF
jgi:hypothetical protein